MKSKAEVRNSMLAYLEERKRTFENLDEVEEFRYEPDSVIEWGPRKGEVEHLYTASYDLPIGTMGQLIFITASAQTGEVLYSRGPHGILEELELPEDPEIESEKDLIREVFQDVFEAGDFSFGEASEVVILFESYDYNLEFQYDTKYGKMIYGGLYVRLLENNNAYRLQDMIEYFDAQQRPFAEIVKPLKDKNLIELRVHEAVVRSHLLEIFKEPDISWEMGLKDYVSVKSPY